MHALPPVAGALAKDWGVGEEVLRPIGRTPAPDAHSFVPSRYPVSRPSPANDTPGPRDR